MTASFRNRLGFERALWRQGIQPVAGVDEAGRGPLAGPVVAAAVCLPHVWLEGRIDPRLNGLNDSKQLTAEERERYFAVLMTHGKIHHAVAIVDAATIDEINILRATHRAMNLALERLPSAPQHVLVDGTRVNLMRPPQTPLVKGDARSYSIAAASVLAKVTRDRLMLEFDRQFPGYGFAAHKGYGTPEHLAALAALGSCAIHRRSFAPVRPPERDLFGWAGSAPAATRPPAAPPA